MFEFFGHNKTAILLEMFQSQLQIGGLGGQLMEPVWCINMDDDRTLHDSVIKPQGEVILKIRELGQGESCNLLYID